MKPLSVFIAALLFYSLTACSAEPTVPQLKLIQTIELPGVHGRIDHMDIDLNNKRLFVAALENDTLEVIDLASGRVLKTIHDLGDPQGIAYVPDNNTVWIAGRKTGNLTVLDGQNYTAIQTIHFGDEADNLHYLTRSHLVLLGYGNGGIALIDALSFKLVETETFSGHPEGVQGDEKTGRIFASVPGSQSIVVFDSQARKIASIWKARGVLSNYPLAIESPLRYGAYFTHVPSMISIFNAQNGEFVSEKSSPFDVDDLYFDNVQHHLFLIAGEGRVEVWAISDEGTLKTVAFARTARGARTGLFSPELDLVFVAVPEQNGKSAQVVIFSASASR